MTASMSTPSATPRASVSGPPGVPQDRQPPGSTDAYRAVPNGPPMLKPIGIINEHNTCFLNSTFQALTATAPLITLIHTTPSESLHPVTHVPPSPIVDPHRIPSLQPETLEPPLYPLLPITRAFQTSLQKAWKMKDAGGGTSGSQEMASNRSMSLRTLLREISKKYDQYDDYEQQDSHELLRHLLDSMEMEEKDVIKRLQVPSGTDGPKTGSRGVDGISPMVSPLPSPARSRPPSPKAMGGPDLPGLPAGAPLSAGASSDGASGTSISKSKSDHADQRMIPFVDVLFGGMFASVIICERCKAVSHTYEGFLDISLSLRDEPRIRKRDRLKAFFQPKGSKASSNDANPTPTSSALSDTEVSDAESKEADRDRRKSLDKDYRPGEIANPSTTSSSAKTFGGLKTKTSFSFRKKGTSRPNSFTNLPAQASVPEAEKVAPLPPPPALSAAMSPRISTSNIPGPSPAQVAYIQRILHGGAAGDAADPLARLRAAQQGTQPPPEMPTSGSLLESLRSFTSVEVMEGENAFACRKCWRIKGGKYKGNGETLAEEDESVVSPLLAAISPSALSPTAITPSISIMDTSSASSETSSLAPPNDVHLGRVSSAASRSSAGSSPGRSSPLRRQIDTGMPPLAQTESAKSDSAASDGAGVQDGPDGLSDTDSSVDKPPLFLQRPVGRPSMPPRKKSSHFVMRRAFKRYLIAKAPEVLVFHFKRFKQTQKTGLMFQSFIDLKKLDDFVSFPETLDMAPFLAPDRNDYKVVQTPSGPRAPFMNWQSAEQGPEAVPVMYRLYSVVVHLGNMGGGHYIAYCLVDPERMFDLEYRPPTEEMQSMSMGEAARDGSALGDGSAAVKADKRVWCFCSDTTIRLASVEEVLKARAYICFYEKVHH